MKNTCSWLNENNPLYVDYHDNEWCKPKYDDHDLFELLILESFQAGLSWECVLNKREAFRSSFDNFDIIKVSNYKEDKINELLENKDIIRNRLKIQAAINNAKVFKKNIKHSQITYGDLQIIKLFMKQIKQVQNYLTRYQTI